MFKTMQIAVGSLLITALIACDGGKQNGGTGVVRIATDPVNAKIYVNGERQPNSPQERGEFLILELPAGEHKIEARKEDGDFIYAASQSDVFVTKGSSQPITLKLTQSLTEAAQAKKQAEAERQKAQEDSGVVSKGNLMWMRCAMGQTWAGSSCTNTGKKYTWGQAMNQKHSFAGYADWRLPTREELLSIRYCSHGVVNDIYSSDSMPYTDCAKGSVKPSVNQTDFPNTPTDSGFWSSSPYPGFEGKLAWGVFFAGGDAGSDYGDGRGGHLYVRLVRDVH